MGPPNINLPPPPQAPPTPLPLMPAQGTKPRQNTTSLNPTVLGALGSAPSQNLGTKTLLGT